MITLLEITNEDEYNFAMERLEQLFDCREGDTRLPEFMHIVDLLEAYEEKHFPIREYHAPSDEEFDPELDTFPDAD